ncbi:MAG TPA: peptidyl-prolyl cis-trans isomerase [Bryobacteraceae bacterium]|nr:peptidyl-prolyl cis-trans isomerase [Bryobacteraceae bacterium]
MFDLFRNREKIRKYGMGGILVLVSASMLLYLVPSYNTGSSASDPVVVQIAGVPITEVEVRRLIRNQTKGRQIPSEIIPNYVPQLIEEMITERAMAYEASKLGLQVTDKDLSDTIRQMYSNLFPDGKFVGKEIYAAMLAQQNLTIEEFEADLKRQLLITRLRDIALEGTVVSPAEIEQEYRKKNDQIKLQYVKLTQDKYKKEAEPSAQDLQDYFKANAVRYQIPEKKNLVVLVADQAKIEQSINPTDAELQAAYNQNLANYRLPERVHARHILLMTQGKPAADEPKIKAKAEDLLKQLKAGADFAELAKNNSDDTGSAAKGGDLDWVTRGQMVPEFEQATFSLQPGQISGLVKTQYGYHIIQVLAHEQARVKPFSEVKDELAKQYKQQRASDRLQQISDTAQAALQKDKDHPDKVAADLGMQLVRTDTVDLSKAVPEVAGNADFDQSLSGLKAGDVSQPVALGGNKLVLAEVTGITPGRPATLDEVKSQVHDALVSNKLMYLVQDKAKQLADAAKANGGDLAKAAKAMGLEAKTTEPFKRQATVEGLGPASYVEEAFNVPVGTVLNPIPMAEGTAVVKLIEHDSADMSKLPEQRAGIRDQIKSEKARERNTMFEAGLVDELTRQGVIKPHNDVIKRIIASFRSAS